MDIDTDFASSCRYGVIHYMREKYGHENVAQVMTFNNMQAKAILDTMGKVMNIPVDEITEFKKMLNNRSIVDILVDNPKVKREYRQYINYCSRLEGLPRSTSLHAGGIVICPQGHAMSEYSALTLSKENEIAVQCTKKTVEKVGLVKYDFLATSILDVINDTLKSIGSSYYEFKYNFEDEKVWDYICSGESAACFQIESNFMTDILLKLEPRSIEELCAVISLGRPDTVGEVDNYVLRKFGFVDSEYYDDVLKPVLEPTYGCLIYQETFMQIAKVYAGYSDGEADSLRKGLGQKNKELVKEEAEKFYNRAISLGRPEKIARQLADIMSDKGGYCFNKSHGVAYAIISYMCCYLKYYYPVQFMVATINNQKKPESGQIDFDGVAKYTKAAKDMGIKLSNPNISLSNNEFQFDAENNSIIYGFALIKGLSTKSIDNILKYRPFESFEDCLNKIGTICSVSDFVALIKANAFKTIDKHSQLELARQLCKFRYFEGKEKQKPIKKCNKTNIKYLLDNGYITPNDVDNQDYCLEVFNNARFDEVWENFKVKYFSKTPLDWEMETLSTFLSGSPFDGVKLPNWDIVKDEEIGYAGGVVLSVKETVTKKKGEKMCFLNVDVNGSIFDIVVFPKQYNQYLELLKTGKCLVIKLTKTGDKSGKFVKCLTLEDYLNKTQYMQGRRK